MKTCILLLTAIAFLIACQSGQQPPAGAEPAPAPEPTPEATSLLGEPLFAPEPSEAQLEKFVQAKKDYEAAPNDPDKLIWYGRRTGYLGRYRDAIAIITEGVKKHPQDARMLRHRGHRYISIREFDKAIADLERATQLIEGTENEIEPDGIPNARNMPISTLHGNIWYHLGLAYYLEHDWENALRAYRKCREVDTNNDNLVSSGHWLYMILHRMGRGGEAAELLGPITADMDIVENDAYHQLCLFYKGEMKLQELQANGTAGSSDAVSYGIANWLYYSGREETGLNMFKIIMEEGQWNAFGYIAAEVDLAKSFD